jgi:hypothetical protein
MISKSSYGINVGDLVTWNKMISGKRDLDVCGIVTENRGSGLIKILIENQEVEVQWNQVRCIIDNATSQSKGS